MVALTPHRNGECRTCGGTPNSRMRRMTATSSVADSLREEEQRIRELARAAEAGEFAHAGWDAIEYLASQLPDGYVLDEHNHVIRTDPGLPDHFYNANPRTA